LQQYSIIANLIALHVAGIVSSILGIEADHHQPLVDAGLEAALRQNGSRERHDGPHAVRHALIGTRAADGGETSTPRKSLEVSLADAGSKSTSHAIATNALCHTSRALALIIVLLSTVMEPEKQAR
jgi:hypothetical protein